MIYIFEILGTEFIKLGYTKTENVYYRIHENGFYGNKHPFEICDKLSPQNLKLLHVYYGNIKVGTSIRRGCPSFCGEFCEKNMLSKLIDELDKLRASEVDELRTTKMDKLFDRPNDDFFETENFVKQPCCGGKEFVCHLCNKSFPREIMKAYLNHRLHYPTISL